jgi:drug/metabolite transporter (DMT)-like permease
MVVPVTSLWVVVSTIIGVGWLDNVLSAVGVMGVGLVVAGNIVVTRYGSDAEGASLAPVEGPPRGTGTTPRLALVWAAASGIGFGFMVPLVDVIGSSVGRLWALPTLWGAELLLGLPVWLAMRVLPRLPRGSHEWLMVGRVGLFEITGFVALSMGLSLASVATVSPASSLGTALAVLSGVVLLKERPPKAAIVGALLASLGVVLAAM